MTDIRASILGTLSFLTFLNVKGHISSRMNRAKIKSGTPKKGPFSPENRVRFLLRIYILNSNEYVGVEETFVSFLTNLLNQILRL